MNKSTCPMCFPNRKTERQWYEKQSALCQEHECEWNNYLKCEWDYQLDYLFRKTHAPKWELAETKYDWWKESNEDYLFEQYLESV